MAAASAAAVRAGTLDAPRTPMDRLQQRLAAAINSAATLSSEEGRDVGILLSTLLVLVCDLAIADQLQSTDQQHQVVGAAARALVKLMRVMRMILPEDRFVQAVLLPHFERILLAVLPVAAGVYAAAADAASGASVLLTLAATLQEVFFSKVLASPAHLDKCCLAVLHSLPALEPEQQARAWQMLIALLREVGQAHLEERAGAAELLDVCEALFHELIEALLVYEDCLDDAGFAAARDALRMLVQRAEVQWERGRQQRRLDRVD